MSYGKKTKHWDLLFVVGRGTITLEDSQHLAKLMRVSPG